MRIPIATYRVQLHKDFRLEALHRQLPYLEKLGISTIYGSPIFQARPGSSHGYDVLNPWQVNDEIGTLEQWRALKKEMKQRGMTWLQDIVPNHAAFDGRNPWLCRLFELGPQSPFYDSFDIDWDYPDEALKGKVMAPFLGNEPEEAIRNGELKCGFDHEFFIEYFEHRYPASARSYSFLLELILKYLETHSGKSVFLKFKELTGDFNILNNKEEQWQEKKKTLVDFLNKNKTTQAAISHAIKKINSSTEMLQQVLDQQYFRFVHWRTTEEKINYRRFFTINDLICLRMEDAETFSRYHQFIKQLCDEDLVDGLRIDHVDGLADPATYLNRLRKLVGDEQFMVVEKILDWDEDLPQNWPIQGSSGYGFLATANQLFTDPNGEETFTEVYREISAEGHSYEELVFRNKEFILKSRMGGELQNLTDLLKTHNLLPKEEHTNLARWKEALAGLLAAWPVYRIYPKRFPLRKAEKQTLEEAYQTARKMLHAPHDELEHLRLIFAGEADAEPEDQRYFLQRCQQFTGPLAAKGVEDTTFYTYNMLLSHNEVGDTPAVFGIDAASFHQRMQHLQKHFPLSINGTATHDTNRGEDARMRLNVLSEMPEQWFSQVTQWRKMNAKARMQENVPDVNEEYFIYQSLLGAWPWQFEEDFFRRTKAYLQKALREAKVHSSWASPDEEYENGVIAFLNSILENEEFKASFEELAKKLAFVGAVYSLGQVVLKTLAPGIPDIYQGNELWDLSYVDPDNRRPVNYVLRQIYLDKISDNSDMLRKELLDNYENGRIKMFTLYKALEFRKTQSKLFEKGEYIPLKTKGDFAENAIGFARKAGTAYCIAVVPQQVLKLCAGNKFPLGKRIWENTEFTLPAGFPEKWINVFTGEKLNAHNSIILLKDILNEFPVAILKPDSDEI